MMKFLQVVPSTPGERATSEPSAALSDRRCILGTAPDGTPVEIDVGVLTDTRALVQANSGFGKSWLLRRVLEQSHGAFQHLIIDPDGEFVTLRERLDLAIFGGEGGDAPVEPATARELALLLLESNLSAVLDLSDMLLRERQDVVAEFLNGVMHAPRSLWHPALVVIDEAHEFAPQQGAASSKRPVIDLMTKGRKRGYGAILATQRLAALDKNAAAQASNRLIGHCSMEADQRRAARELGLGRKQQEVLLELGVGEFCVQGPAIATQMVRVKVGSVETSHGSREGARHPMGPSPALAEVLPKLIEALRASGSSGEANQHDVGEPTASTATHEASEKQKGGGRRAVARREAGTGHVDGASRAAKSRRDGEHHPANERGPVGTSEPSSGGAVRASIDQYSGDVEITIRIEHPRR